MNGLIASLNSKHDELGELQTYLNAPGADIWTRVSVPLLRDTPHQNRAGWLPALVSSNPAPMLDQHSIAWATAIASNAHDPDRAALVAAFPSSATATADAVESSALDESVKRRWFNEVFGAAVPTRAARSRLAWKRWADSNYPHCPYIEFAASEAGGLSRVVFDFVNDILYIGVHYNWVEGYNPFFRVVGAAHTL